MAAPLRYPLILLAWGRWRQSICPYSPPPQGWCGRRSPRSTGGRCSPTRSWAGAGRHPCFHAAVRRRRVTDRPDHRAALWPSARWRRLASRLPLLLAVPHLARRRRRCCCSPKAAGSGSGCRFLTPPVDRYGIGLGLTMALKESAFVLWVIYGLLGRRASPTGRQR